MAWPFYPSGFSPAIWSEAFWLGRAKTPTVSIGDVSDLEGTAGAKVFSFPASLSAASGQVVQVEYTTSELTAEAPGDYLTTTGTLTFAPGVTSQAVHVPVVTDTLAERDEVRAAIDAHYVEWERLAAEIESFEADPS